MTSQGSKGFWNAALAAVLLLLTFSSASYAGMLAVSPSSLNFGTCMVGSAGAAQAITLTNTSRQSMGIKSVSLSSLAFTYAGPSMPVMLGPGKSFTAMVAFVPTAARAYTAQLIFQRMNGSRVTIYLAGTGTVASAAAPTSPNVTPTTPTIIWPVPAPVTYGVPLSGTQLNATVGTTGGFVYSPAAGTILHAGTQTLSTTFTPSDTTNYTTATASVTLTVNKATPTIYWPTPAAITSGTVLSGTQLNATANVLGTLTYSPAAGTVLSSGSHSLSVTFTPSDGTDYNTATASVLLTVNSTATTPGTLTVTPTAVSFGNVDVGATASQTVTVANTGSGSVTISSVSTSGSGVNASGISGVILAAGQTANLSVTFTANGTGNLTGAVSVASNATNPSVTIPVGATGVAPSVVLTWGPDSSATGGFNVYSSTTSGGPYILLTSSPISTTSFTDTTVRSGFTYYYVVTAMSASTESAYSNQAAAVVP